MRWGQLGDGHVSARDPELTDHFWLLDWGVPFGEATVDQLVLVGPGGEVKDADGNPTGARQHRRLPHPPPDPRRPPRCRQRRRTPTRRSARRGRPTSSRSGRSARSRARSCSTRRSSTTRRSRCCRPTAASGSPPRSATPSCASCATTACSPSADSVEESVGWFVMAERVAEVHVKAPERQGDLRRVGGDRRLDARPARGRLADVPVATPARSLPDVVVDSSSCGPRPTVGARPTPSTGIVSIRTVRRPLSCPALDHGLLDVEGERR